MLIGIYKITSPTGKIYIGQSKNIVKRLKGYSKLKCKTQILLYNSLAKHGYDNHHIEILISGDFTGEELDSLEIKYVKEYNSFAGWSKKGLNLTTGGKKNFKVSKQATDRQVKSRLISRDAGDILNVKLTKEQVYEIKRLIALNYEKRTIGKMFNVAETTIAEIFSGRNWKDIPEYILQEDDYKDIQPIRCSLSTKQKEEIKWLVENSILSYANIGELYNCGPKNIQYYHRVPERKLPIIFKKHKTRFLTKEQYDCVLKLLDFGIDIEKINKLFNINTDYIDVTQLNEEKVVLKIPEVFDFNNKLFINIVNYCLININSLSIKYDEPSYTFYKFKLKTCLVK